MDVSCGKDSTLNEVPGMFSPSVQNITTALVTNKTTFLNSEKKSIFLLKIEN